MRQGKRGLFFMTLDEIKVGETAKILKVNGQGALRKRLLDMGLTPKTLVTLQKLAPMGDPLEFTLRGYELTLRKADCAMVEVERL